VTSVAGAAILGIALGATTASAQSKRYPPEPVDADKAAEEHSDFWERALEPDRGRYDVLLARARRLVDGRTTQDLIGAVEILDAAIHLLPDAPDAHYLRGWAHELAQDWPACADDYAAVAARDPDFEPAPNPRVRGGLADGLGVCLARAGRFEDAEEVLEQATAAGATSAGVWLHLGEVDMALGRLDDAIAALDGALKLARSNDHPAIHWLRAMAFDRARQPSDAADAADTAIRADPSLSRVLNPALPSAPVEDAFYLAGLAFEAHNELRPASPERALLYFREYLARSGKTPWKKRAEEHLAALQKFDPAEALTRPGARQGTSTLDAPTIAKALRKDLPALGKCLKAAPRVVTEVRVVLHGPPLPAPRAGQPVLITSRPPAAGVTVKLVAQIGDEASANDLADATRCLQLAAAKLKVPRLEKGAWLQLLLPVIYQ